MFRSLFVPGHEQAAPRHLANMLNPTNAGVAEASGPNEGTCRACTANT